ncbi:MAG: amidohydrolase [Thermofilum sp. ex4484_15]|nr:MAG: amidohydrolase [Thermofilum sp. ex4484_15]
MANLTLSNCKLFLNGKWVRGSIVIDGNSIRYIGPTVKEKGTVWDLEGRPVIPGLIDSHVHLIPTALNREVLDLRRVKSIRELKTLIAKECGKSGWIIGRGWDQENFEEARMPSLKELDEACSSNPVLLIRICGHLALANSLALRKLGLRKGDGLLFEEEVTKALESVLKPGEEKLLRLLKELLYEMPKKGITMVHTLSSTPQEFYLLQLIKVKWGLPVRVRVYFDAKYLDYLLNSKLIGGFGDEYLRISGIKVIMDGSLGARTAYLRERYEDANTRGKLLLNSSKLAELLERARGLNLQVAVHAIGDGAIREVIKALSLSSARGDEVRIEHCSLTPPELLDELAKLRPIISVQPHFIISDWWAERRLGRRCRWLYPFKTMLRAKLKLSGSSDSPVEPWDPWEGMYAAVERGKEEGSSIFKYTSSEKLSISEALTMYTEGGARACREYPDYGSIKIGSKADLTVLEYLPTTPKELKEVEVYATLVGGEITYLKR